MCCECVMHFIQYLFNYLHCFLMLIKESHSPASAFIWQTTGNTLIILEPNCTNMTSETWLHKIDLALEVPLVRVTFNCILKTTFFPPHPPFKKAILTVRAVISKTFSFTEVLYLWMDMRDSSIFFNPRDKLLTFHSNKLAFILWMWTVRHRQLARGPCQAAAAQDVDVQMVDRLASIRSIVDHNPVAISQTCIFGYFPGRHHQVAQQLVDKEQKRITLWNVFNIWLFRLRNKCETRTCEPNLASSVTILGPQGNIILLARAATIIQHIRRWRSLKNIITTVLVYYLNFKCIISLGKKFISN